jgi:hypothetical protein
MGLEGRLRAAHAGVRALKRATRFGAADTAPALVLAVSTSLTRPAAISEARNGAAADGSRRRHAAARAATVRPGAVAPDRGVGAGYPRIVERSWTGPVPSRSDARIVVNELQRRRSCDAPGCREKDEQQRHEADWELAESHWRNGLSSSSLKSHPGAGGGLRRAV